MAAFRIRLVVVAVAALLVLAAAPTALAASDLTVRGSAEQVDVTGAPAGAPLTLLHGGATVQTASASDLGGYVFRNVAPGGGYQVQDASGVSDAVTVLSDSPAPPSTTIYNQTLPTSGYGYLTTRDGTKLAIDVRTPGGSGPYPTLIEYSGYGYANPAGAESGISPLLTLLGFAVVDVNMRGTGCSGGAFDYFEPLQGLDGYDVIETVARQPWALNHKVGMAGISYGGISQLFVAEDRPPSLAAIAPLSVIDSTATTLYPGGILNTGFALSWAEDRVHDAMPASATGGQPWALQRIQGGDTTCAANQVLHASAVDLIAKIRSNNYYVPSVADPLDPITFVDQISVPTFMACQFTDEQTGGHCPDLAEHFTGTDRKWFTFTNGVHTDSLDPATFNRWYDFLRLFVAGQAPGPNPLAALGSTVYNVVLGINGVNFLPDPIQSQTSYAAALSEFEALPPIRILFDNGAGSSMPGYPYPASEQSFSRFPLPGTHARAWYLGSGGALRRNFVRAWPAGADSFTWNPAARPANDFAGDTGAGTNGLWTATPPYNWVSPPAGSAVAYVTPRLRHTTTVVGAGGVTLWIRTSVPDVDLQATISEVRPDGKEEFVQNGWLRASERKLGPQSTPLDPQPTFMQSDVRPLRSGQWTKLTIPLYYEGHIYRAGSRIRVTVEAPDGDQPIWAFAETVPSAPTTVSIAHSWWMPSQLVLPVVPGITVNTGLPPCPGERGEPCRTYAPFSNQSAPLW